MDEYSKPSCGINHELNENHIRKISVLLYAIEKDISLIKLYLKYNPSGRMFELENSLTEEEKQKVLSQIILVKQYINEFANEFNLHPKTQNMRGIISGGLAIHWAYICEIEPRRLKTYGKVNT